MTFSAISQPFAPSDAGSTVNGFQDDFNGNVLGPNWVSRGAGVYSIANGMVHIGNATGDPNHLLYELPAYSGSVQEVLARMRVTSFGSGPYARGGVAVAVTPATSQGIDFSFRDNDGAGHPYRHTALLDDYREWGPLQALSWLNNTWYWVRLRQEPNAASQGGANDVFAKIWLADGTVPEPAGWQLTWNYTPARSVRAGYAGLMAGSSSGGATDFSEFDVDYILIKSAGLPAIVVAPSSSVQSPASITNQPQSIAVAELAPASFSVGASGSPPPTFQWYKNDIAIPGATNSAYSIPTCLLSENGARFTVVAANLVSNLTRTATSGVAILTVYADTVPPALLGAQSLGLGLVRIAFSERIFGVSDLSHYTVTGSNGNVMLLSAALDSTQTNILLNVSGLVENALYTLTVAGIADQSASANLSPAASVTFTGTQPKVLITEFVADNSNGLMDTDGAHSDWLELQNQSSFAVDLAGWHLTDEPLDMARWTFPTTWLGPGEFLVVFASGKDRRAAGAELHTNFKLNAAGDYLALSRPDGSIAHQFMFGPQHTDASFESVGLTNQFMTTPTPGASNGPGVFGFVSDLVFSSTRGFFESTFSLSITTATVGAEIWFTTDGSIPAKAAAGSTLYTNPILISNTTTLRAVGFLTGYAPSELATHSFISVASTAKQPVNPPGFPGSWEGYTADYEMDPQVVTNTLPGYDITNALLSLPALSLTAPRDDLFSAARGIYYNSDQQGDAWERETSVELIMPSGSPGFQCEAGLRVHGYTSRYHANTLKHSLRLSFRNRYGPSKLRFPLLSDAGVESFDTLVLRACSTDSYAIGDGLPRWETRRATYIRDQWMRDAMRDLGQLTSHGRYVNLWINGLYWGIYNICETLDAGFAASHLGGPKEEYDVIKDYFFVDEGDRQAWDAAATLAAAGFASEANYQRLQGNNPDGTRNTNYPVYLNISNYVDYVMVHIMSGANDWPMNNWTSCRRRGPASEGFRFCVWDQEISNESLTTTANVFCQPFAEASENSCLSTPGQYHGAYFYDILRRTSPSFRQAFMDRAWFAHTGNGPLTPAANATRWLARQNEIDHAMVAETARWGDARREPPYTRQANWLAEMQWVANYWASNQVRAIARYRSVGIWPVLGPPTLNRPSGYFSNGMSFALAQTNAQGTIWFTLDGADPRAPGGSVAPTAKGYTAPLTLTNSTRVRARVYDGSNWSPPVDGTYLPLTALTNLCVTEIYYNPPGQGVVDGEAFEFVELQNQGAFALDLSGVHFNAGIGFSFSNATVVPPGAYLVLARDPIHFGSRFPAVVVQGWFTGKLNNDGETIALNNALGDPIFSFFYGTSSPWPASADGSGDSLHRVYAGNPDSSANWCAAPPTPGAPAPLACRDSDGDHLLDEWETTHGLDPFDPVGDNGAEADPDHDGVSNLKEFLAGTDPHDVLSYFKIENVSGSAGGSGVTFSFSAVSNKTYSVEFTPALPGPWLHLANIPARLTNGIAIFVDPVVVTNRFYRITTP
ncbi:MAG TPA: lamin tail domain-containing protein [Candidatus Saccharimonadales bacterium]|nr:lamin tail domain-containing protein [Candidatus Saccharimonadales bacterium]